jgi:hypothetical protein
VDPDELQLWTWKTFLRRCQLERARDEAQAADDPKAAKAAERALRAIPAISALDALRANADLVSRLSVQRWIGMKVARDQGFTLEQIGNELGVSRQSAWEFLQRKIAEHQGRAPSRGSGESRSTPDGTGRERR